MKIAVDCDDAAIDFKDEIFNYLQKAGYDITDLQYSASHDCDYPEIAFNLAETIKNKEYDRGFIFCGTGLGVAMMANKRSPGLMRETLKSFVAHYQNDLRDEPVRSARALIPLKWKARA